MLGLGISGLSIGGVIGGVLWFRSFKSSQKWARNKQGSKAWKDFD